MTDVSAEVEALMARARRAVWAKLYDFVAALLPDDADVHELCARARETGAEADDLRAHHAIQIAVVEADVVDAFLSGVEHLASEAEAEMAQRAANEP